MKIEVIFPKLVGSDEEKHVVYWNKSFSDFPCYVMYGLTKYEMVMYDSHKTESDTVIAYYGRLDPTDSRWYSQSFTNISELIGKGTDCECGARHTSFPDIHMMFCKLWRRF